MKLRIVAWLAVLCGAVIVAVSYRAAVPPDDRITRYYFALATSLCAVIEIWRELELRWLSQPRRLERAASGLWDTNPVKQRRAMFRLSRACGARFGLSSLFFGTRHKTQCELWKDWWQGKRNFLRWDPLLRIYVEDPDGMAGVEAERSPQNDAPPTSPFPVHPDLEKDAENGSSTSRT